MEVHTRGRRHHQEPVQSAVLAAGSEDEDSMHERVYDSLNRAAGLAVSGSELISSHQERTCEHEHSMGENEREQNHTRTSCLRASSSRHALGDGDAAAGM